MSLFERKKIPTFERKKRLQLKIKTEVTIDGCDIEDIEDPCESGLVGTFEDFEDCFFISDLHCFKKFLLMYSHTLELELAYCLKRNKITYQGKILHYYIVVFINCF